MNLPPEVGGVCQPYSMLPLLARTGHDPRYASPALGTLVAVDRSELSIRMCLVAPSNVQRAAQAAGVTAMVMIRPRGIEKVDPRLTPTTQALTEVRHVQLPGTAYPLTLRKDIADMIEGLGS